MRKLLLLKYFLLFALLSLSISAFIVKDDVELPYTTSGLAADPINEFSQGLSKLFDDGPYTFITDSVNKKGLAKSIVAGKVHTEDVSLNTVSFSAELSAYKGVSKIAAISDIHGQHEVFLKVLRANAVINDKDEWAFGEGHLVITGDIFDRGDQVTEALWFVYELEKQAKAAGGKVHYLLGNHEYMVLHGDTRYLHEKYMNIAKLLETSYKDLFSAETILGRWLRSKSTIIKINDKLFVHGGISETFADLGLSLEEANSRYRESIDIPKKEIRQDELLAPLYNSTSPIWYRGYFREDLSHELISSVLARYGATSIMVGHTSQSQVLEKYDGLVYAIDSSIKKGKSGEILLIEGEQFIRGTMEGERILF